MPKHVTHGHHSGGSISTRLGGPAFKRSRGRGTVFKGRKLTQPKVTTLFKKRKGMSHTKTKVGLKVRENNPAESHSGIGISTVRVGNWKPSRLLKGQTTVGRWRYQQMYRFMITGTAGVQSIYQGPTILTISKILTTSGVNYNLQQADVALEQLNPYLKTTGSTYLGAVATPLDDRFIVKSVNLEFEFTSLSGVGAYLDVYVCKAKKDARALAVTAWADGLQQQAEGQTVYQPPVLGAINGFLPGYPTPAVVHSKPSESQLFKNYWSIAKVKSLEFTGNASQRLNVDIGINKIIKTNVLRELQAETTLNLRGITWDVFFVLRGAVVEDTTSTTPASYGAPTYGAAKVAMIVQEKYIMCGVKGNAGRLNVSTVVDQIGPGTTNPNTSILNEIDIPSIVSSVTVGP